MVSIIYFVILKYIAYIFLLFTIDVLVSNIFNCISLVLFEFSKWNKYFFFKYKMLPVGVQNCRQNQAPGPRIVNNGGPPSS